MVFKKPYAFLIKYFKIIHLVLTFFAIYLIMRVNSILGFFNGFIRNSVSKMDAASYISNLYIVVIILSIIISLIVLILMKYKKKPYLLYLILIAVYLAIGFIISYSNAGLEAISSSVLSMKDLLLYRDILKILLLFQYVSFGFIFVRALGFDIKKFNFDADLEGFEVTDDDEEEVELTIKDANKYERKIRRLLRELRYYYFENKLYIDAIFIIVVIIFLSGFIVQKEVLNRIYAEGETFSTDYFTFSVTNSYVSNMGYDNKKITDTDTSFIIVKLKVKNNKESRELNKGQILLYVGDKSYSSKLMYSKPFQDLGKAYTGAKIKGLSTYIFIFNVENKYLDEEKLFIYGEDNRVRLKPVNLDEVSEKFSYKLGEEIDLSNSLLGSGKFNISSYEFGDKFIYDYTYEVMGEEYPGSITIKSVNKKILHLVIDSSYPSGFDDYTLLSTYGTLRYKKGEVEYSSNFENKTPGSYEDGVYITVEKEVEQADSIWFDIVLRNKHYVYNIK